MVLSVTVNPTVDHTLFVNGLKVGDTNRVQRTERDAGGKGINVSRVYAELGGKAKATGFLGGGPGAYVRNVLDRQGVIHDFVEVDGETRVNFNVESGDGPPTTFNERGPEVGLAKFKELIEKCQELSRGAAWVVIGGSLPPGLPHDAYKILIEAVQCEDCGVVLDADGEPMKLGLEARPSFIKPNLKEASRLLGRDLTVEEAPKAAQELFQKLRDTKGIPPFVVLSMGKHGAVLACGDGVFMGHSPKVEAKSTIGSGDSLIGGVLWGLHENMPLPEAFRWGLAAGAATAMTDGTEIARRRIVLELLEKARVEQIS
jgi:1-phosphofructokinase